MCLLVMDSEPSNAANAFLTYQNKVADFEVCQCSGHRKDVLGCQLNGCQTNTLIQY